MRSLIRILGLIAVGSLVVLESCVPIDEVVVDLAPVLTSSTWKFKEVVDNDALVKGFYEGYYAGDVITFFDDGTCVDKLLNINGAGTWTINSSQTVLSVNFTFDDGSTRNENWDILSITSSELYFEVNNPPAPVLKMRYIH